MTEEKKGRQTPTQSCVLPYSRTHGGEAVELYEQSGRQAIEWQENLVNDIMAYGDDGLWVHQKFGFSLPRRNGKNEILVFVERWALANGLRVCHTAHRTFTSTQAWNRLHDNLSDSGYEEIGRKKKGEEIPEKGYRILRQSGRESIEDVSGGRVDFRTRTPNGGLGEGFDILIIDEAQEYTEAQASALKYTVSDSKNPLTLFCGTPPTAVSVGTVFPKMRESALAGEAYETGWAEWSIPAMTKNIWDTDLWYETNPSMGYHLDERKIGSEIGADLTDFNIQRLGVWIRYSQKSAISAIEWNRLKADKPPEIASKLYVGVKFGPDAENVAVSVAARTAEKKIYVECLGCKPVKDGMEWILQLLRGLPYDKAAVDGANGQKLLAGLMKDARLKPPMLPTVKEIITANSTFEQGIFQRELCHGGQKTLTRVVTNCEHRPIGSAGGFGYRVVVMDGDNADGMEVALIDSVAVAYWLCHEKTKEKRKTKVSY